MVLERRLLATMIGALLICGMVVQAQINADQATVAGKLSLAAEAPALPEASAAGRPPNIILLFTDDQYWDSLDYMPTLRDDILPQAMQFTNAFATTPLCCPSRATILTGLYAFHHNVKTNGPPLGGFAAFNDAQTIATGLQATSDYGTHYLGKYMNGYSDHNTYIPPGWDNWFTFNDLGDVNRYYYDYWVNDNGAGVYYGTEQAHYSTDVLRDRAVDVITTAGDAPFLMYLSVYAPHRPALVADRHAGAYADIPPHRPPSFDEADISDKPAWLGELPPVEHSDVDSLRADQLATLLAVDEALAAMLQALESTGQKDNTVIIFTSDNGFSWGEHRVVGKWCPYESCLRVPMVIWYPGLTVGGVNESLVLNIDLVPTIADLADVELGAAVDGLSLVPLLDGTSASLREDFLFEHWQNLNAQNWSVIVPTYVGVRNSRWKYVEHETGERELYDLVEDPHELVNVADAPEHAAMQAQLAERIQAIRAGVEPTPTPTPTPAPTPTPTMTATPAATPGAASYLPLIYR